MKSEVGSLRHTLVLERAIIIVEKLAQDLCAQWFQAWANGQPLPETHVFIRRVGEAGLDLPSRNAVARYLESCRDNNALPEVQPLVHVLLPWSWRYRPPIPYSPSSLPPSQKGIDGHPIPMRHPCHIPTHPLEYGLIPITETTRPVPLGEVSIFRRYTCG